VNTIIQFNKSFFSGFLLLSLLSLLSFAQVALTAPVTQSLGHQDKVQVMYIAYYGRPGDPDGIHWWKSELDLLNGKISSMIDAFGTSNEYNSRFGSLTANELVNNIYLQLFGRNADAAGLAFYVNRLESGEMTLASIALNIADGVQEGNADALILSNKLVVANAFTDAVSSQSLDYSSGHITSAKALLDAVDDSQDSLDNGLEQSVTMIANFVGSNCTAIGDDSVRVDPAVFDFTRETDYVRSHAQEPATYRIFTTRDYISSNDGNVTQATMDYMVHHPTGNPKALVVLITGGSFIAAINGNEDNSLALWSGRNFLIRSAHRFMRDGYRVVSIDRPSDYIEYGDIDSGSWRYDAYRNSMDHAVDVAAIIQRENAENLPVIISGTSRGAISTVAINTLASAIAISSPVTRSSRGGSPIGSASLPVSRIERDVHLLIHKQDACPSTLPSYSRDLFNNIQAVGIDKSISEVTGGFRDTVHDDVCGALDYHGFTGIENCAVSKETVWMSGIVDEQARIGNSQPIVQNASFQQGNPVNLSLYASDNDTDDNLSYTVPYNTTTLGGQVSINVLTGIVSYSPPDSVPSAAKDKFVYVVTDGKGGVGRGIVTVNLN